MCDGTGYPTRSASVQMGQKQLPCGLETAKHKGPPLQSVVPLRCQKRCAISAIPSRGASSFRNGKQLPLAPGRDSPPLCRIRCRHQGASARPDGRRLTADVFAGSAVVALHLPCHCPENSSPSWAGHVHTLQDVLRRQWCLCPRLNPSCGAQRPPRPSPPFLPHAWDNVAPNKA